MRKSLFRNMTLWLTILTLLWSSQGYGYVWCVTAEGPTHLENILHNHCDHDVPPGEESDSPATISHADSASCGPCVDLAASYDLLQQRKLFSGNVLSPFLLSIIVLPEWVPTFLVRHLTNNLHLEDPPRVSTTLLAHRTIVLLI